MDDDAAFGIVVGIWILILAGLALGVWLAPKPKIPEPLAWCYVAEDISLSGPCKSVSRQQDI
jgi:hypothetical protein